MRALEGVMGTCPTCMVMYAHPHECAPLNRKSLESLAVTALPLKSLNSTDLSSTLLNSDPKFGVS